MNPIMIDGTGMCGGCRLTRFIVTASALPNSLALTVPILTVMKLIFDEAMSRGAMYPAILNATLMKRRAICFVREGQIIIPNMSLKKNPMPSQEPSVRAHNFDEVAMGYSAETAVDEALRCLGCKNMPCVSGCPVNIHIPEFIAKVKDGDF